MKLTMRCSLNQYELETRDYSRSTDIDCPQCGGKTFRVWFTDYRHIDLTCLNCRNFIHITGVSEDKNRD